MVQGRLHQYVQVKVLEPEASDTPYRTGASRYMCHLLHSLSQIKYYRTY